MHRIDDWRLETPAGPLYGRRWGSGDSAAVLLHSGVTDLRGYDDVANRLADDLPLLAYDRRGHGATPPAREAVDPLDDLRAVLEAHAPASVWLVGSSMGGELAVDAALALPGRVAGLVLLAPAVSGQPEPPDDDPATARLERAITAAETAGDLDEVNRLMTWLWLDGPGQPEGRVGDPARALALEMGRTVLSHHVDDSDPGSTRDAWSQVDRLSLPAVVVWGEYDLPVLRASSAELAGRLPHGTGRELAGTAHLPYLDHPSATAAVIRETVSAG